MAIIALGKEKKSPPHALRDAITWALADEHQIQRLGEHSRKVAVEEYALSVQAQRYKQLYSATLQ